MKNLTETETLILEKLNEKFDGCFNEFYTRNKCAESSYFVDKVRWAIGEISFFDIDHDLTKDEEKNILTAFFA